MFLAWTALFRPTMGTQYREERCKARTTAVAEFQSLADSSSMCSAAVLKIALSLSLSLHASSFKQSDLDSSVTLIPYTWRFVAHCFVSSLNNMTSWRVLLWWNPQKAAKQVGPYTHGMRPIGNPSGHGAICLNNSIIQLSSQTIRICTEGTRLYPCGLQPDEKRIRGGSYRPKKSARNASLA